MKRQILAILLVGMGTTSWGIAPPQNEEEALFVRRIVDFSRDKEYPQAKVHIEEFLEEYPESHLRDTFYEILGNLALSSKLHQESLEWYEKISDPHLKDATIKNRCHALYFLKRYDQLQNELKPLIDEQIQDDDLCYLYAESCFRKALHLYSIPHGLEEARYLSAIALPLFQNLLGNAHYQSRVRLALAEVHRLLGHPQEAARYYSEIVESKETQNEEILFHAALSLCQFDRAKAISLFSTLAKQKKLYYQEATHYWFQLLVKTNEWDLLNQEKALFLAQLPKESLPYYHYYLGKCAYEKKELEEAQKALEECLEYSPSFPYEHSALLLCLSIAHEREDLKKFEEAYTRFHEHYGDEEPEMEQLRLCRARLLAKNGNYDRAYQLLEKMEHSENAHLEKIRLLLLEKRFEEAYSACDKIPTKDESKKIRLALDVTERQLAVKETPEVYAQWIENLKCALSSPSLFEKEEEKRHYRLQLAKAYYAVDQLTNSFEILNSLLEDEKNNADCHFLLALCYAKAKLNPEKIILHGEEALSLQALHPLATQIHLLLFNAYLESSKMHANEEFVHHAAEHLYALQGLHPISFENRLWLARHYSSYAVENYALDEAKKGILLVETLLEDKENWYRFEEEAVQLIHLYMLCDEKPKAHLLIDKLFNFHQQYPHLKWKYIDRTTLAKANLLFLARNFTEALPLYQKLEAGMDAKVSHECQLQLSRLLIQTLPKEDRHLGSFKVMEIAQRLKSLQNFKILLQEPLHLEAALEYAEFIASLQAPESQDYSHLQLLFKIKEEFSSQDDILSKDYHASREKYPAKDRIYQAYMRYVDARIYQLQAEIALSEGNVLESRTKQSAARALYSTLRQGKFAVSPYIIEKAMKGMTL